MLADRFHDLLSDRRDLARLVVVHATIGLDEPKQRPALRTGCIAGRLGWRNDNLAATNRTRVRLARRRSGRGDVAHVLSLSGGVQTCGISGLPERLQERSAQRQSDTVKSVAASVVGIASLIKS